MMKLYVRRKMHTALLYSCLSAAATLFLPLNAENYVTVQLSSTAYVPCYSDLTEDVRRVAWAEEDRSEIGVFDDRFTDPSEKWQPVDKWASRTNVTDVNGTLLIYDTGTNDNGTFFCRTSDGVNIGSNAPTTVLVFQNLTDFHLEITYKGGSKSEGIAGSCVEYNTQIANLRCYAWSFPQTTIISSYTNNEPDCIEYINGTLCQVDDTISDQGENHTCMIEYSAEERVFFCAEPGEDLDLNSFKVCEEKHFPASIACNTTAVVVCVILVLVLLLIPITNMCVLVAVVLIDALLVIGGAIAMGLCEAWQTEAELPPMANATIAMMVLSALGLLVVIAVALFTGSKVKAREAAVR